jgi:putative hydrolase of the HAD superfamily
MSDPTLLLFDLGGVLVENTTFDRLAALTGMAPGAEMKERWLASPAVRGLEMGALSPDEFAARFIDEWRLRCDPSRFLDDFVNWPTGFYPGATALLARLRRHRRVGCLSNSNVLHWRRFRGFVDDFDVALSSHLLGAVKPDRECFERALRACGAEAGEVALFDDSPANVRAALDLGWRALQVDGIEALENRLAAEGWLPSEPV